MKESLYERFRPFKPYDLVLAAILLFLVVIKSTAPAPERLLMLLGGLALFWLLDLAQRRILVPTPLWQAVAIVLVNTIMATLLVRHGDYYFLLSLYLLNVTFATLAFDHRAGILAAVLSVALLTWVEMLTLDDPGTVLLERLLLLVVLLAMVALLVRIKRLHQDALFDAVTGVRNHSYFQVRLREEIQRSNRSGQPTALVLLDLDDFKRINDRFGHTTGDQVLRGVAQRLTKSARAADVVCRYGGEELAVILPGTSLADAAIVAERLRSAVHQQPDERGLGVTTSVGVAVYPDHAPAADELIAAADAALYRAKDAGKNRVDISQPRPEGSSGASSNVLREQKASPPD